MWGEGFLSPGGEQEVAEIIGGANLKGKLVLDIGSGIGGIDRLLVTRYRAARVIGIDVEPELVERSIEDAEKAGLTDHIEYMLVTEGDLTFDDAQFEVVFSKDSIVHVADKLHMMNEVFRVLKPGGLFLGSDWLGGMGHGESKAVHHWLDISGLHMLKLVTAAELKSNLSTAGFKSIRLQDRNLWYLQEVKNEIDSVSGERGKEFENLLGAERAERRLISSTAKLKVVEQGFLRPTHFYAVKPE